MRIEVNVLAQALSVLPLPCDWHKDRFIYTRIGYNREEIRLIFVKNKLGQWDLKISEP